MSAPFRWTRLGILSGIERTLTIVTIALAALALLVAARLLLHARIVHDAPIMLYLGELVGRLHRVPYRDFFDMNTPGVYPFYAALALGSGGSDTALRVADLTLVATQMLAMGLALSPFGWRAAVLGPMLHGLAMLDLAVFHALQRESLAMVPIAIAVALVSPLARGPLARRAALAGLALGIAITIKPALALDAVPFAWVLWVEARSDAPASTVRPIAAWAVALVAPWLVCLAWLAANGALGPFLDMTAHYWPLYGSLGSLHQTLSPSERPGYLLQGLFALGAHRAWFAGAAIALALAMRRLEGPQRRFAWFAGGLTLAHALYPASSGQFWPYHWFPLIWSLGLTCALAFARSPAHRSTGTVLTSIAAVAVVALTLRAPRELDVAVAGIRAPDPYDVRVEEIETFLRAYLQPGDRVQPLDWTGGAVEAMWRAHARLATPFVYDFHFYHHVSMPYIQQLRARFLAALEAARPRFIIRILTEKPWPSGPDTTHEFDGLDTYIRFNYVPAMQGDGYEVLLRAR